MSDNRYYITDRCTGCGACVHRCPKLCVVDTKTPFEIDYSKCDNCGKCFDNCPLMAIKKESR